MQWAQVDGKTRLLVAGKVNKFFPNPTFDPVAAPGVMDEYFRGRNPKSADVLQLFGELEPIRPEYRDHDARIALMDAQGMEGCILLPTLGVGMEQALSHDLPALTAAFRAFNRWMEEDWGFAYQNRIFAAPYITLADPENAARELEWALERDARFVVMVGGPVTTAAGKRAPADEMFDPFWRLANDAGITVCYHGGETSYTKYLGEWGEKDFTEAFRATAFRGLVSADPLQDTIASHLARGLFHRFPNLRIASIEVGSAWVFHLFEKLTKTYGQVPHLFPEDPRETFRRHIWTYAIKASPSISHSCLRRPAKPSRQRRCGVPPHRGTMPTRPSIWAIHAAYALGCCCLTANRTRRLSNWQNHFGQGSTCFGGTP